uniref:Uncharacterized protein n=1 Tax=Glossina morsitans morsitans TaxID=37546 RepID=A0A1B0FAK1_GLOMM
MTSCGISVSGSDDDDGDDEDDGGGYSGSGDDGSSNSSSISSRHSSCSSSSRTISVSSGEYGDGGWEICKEALVVPSGLPTTVRGTALRI